MSGPLAGLRVVELCGGVAGPLCGMYLGDLGADVVKVEPADGDPARGFGPGVFASLNRNKRSVVCDDDAVRALLRTADVVLCEHELPEGTARPELVHCVLTDFGADAGFAEGTGSELVAQAMSGLTAYLGVRSGPPLRLGFEAAGVATGHFALQAVLAALYHRARTGSGQRVVVSRLSSLLCLASTLMAAQSNPDRFEGFHLNGPTATPKTGWRTEDGRITFEFGRGSDTDWERFRERVGLEFPPEQAADWRLLTGLGDRADDAKDIVEAVFGTWDTESLVAAIRDCHGLAAPWLTYADLAKHPQVAEERLLVDVGHPDGPPLRLVGWPWAAAATPAAVTRPVPSLGEHTPDLPALLAEPSAGVARVEPRAPRGRPGLSGPLLGVRVVDLSQGGVGPWASTLLGTMGADVIRVEPPTGDFIRQVGPTQHGMSTTYLKNSYSKRATILNLKDDADRRAARRLVDTADVLLENLRPGVAAKLGMGYDAVRETNPSIVYVSASGYGQGGPLRDAGCTDPHMQAFSGAANLHGPADGDPELFRFFGHLDLNTAQVIVQAVLLGLVARDRLGVGQRIETSMLHAALALQTPNWAAFAAGGGEPVPLGSRSRWWAPDEAFTCKDGESIAVTVTSDAEWQALREALGLADDPRFRDNAGRLADAADLRTVLADVFGTRPSGWWLLHLRRSGVRVGPFLTFDRLRHDERYHAAGYLETIRTPWGPIVNGGPPWRFAATPARFLPPHEPGADTADVLAETGS